MNFKFAHVFKRGPGFESHQMQIHCIDNDLNRKFLFKKFCRITRNLLKSLKICIRSTMGRTTT